MKIVHSFIALVCTVLISLVAAARVVDAEPAFKIYVEHTGIYEVSFERLVESGLGGALPSAEIGLKNFGEPVPVWVEDGGDGLFGPGDRLLFMGEVLRGTYSYLDPYSRFNCYRLSFSDPDRLQGVSSITSATQAEEPARLRASHHLESDRVMVRFRAIGGESEESWYWERLSVADKKPYRHELTLDGIARSQYHESEATDFADALSESVRAVSENGTDGAGRIQSRLLSVFGGGSSAPTVVSLRLGFRGWSEPRHRERASLPHHEIEIRLNGAVIGGATWNGKDHFVHEMEISATDIVDGPNELTVEVPKRLYSESGDFLIDVVLLNWIEIEYVHIPVVGDEQLRLFPDDGAQDKAVELEAGDGSPFEVFLPNGERYRSAGGRMRFSAAEIGDAGFSALKPASAAAPSEVILDRPSNLRTSDRQADYIMITHHTLEEGAATLADFHRDRGLSVVVVDVQDIYDEFNFGILNPQAIKDFLQHAHGNWQAPAPRFVLFVGDASWDYKNLDADDSNYADWTYRPGEKRFFVKNSSTPYAQDAELNHRNLVPTSSYPTTEGHAASDTWFVCFDDGDELPDMAVGRLPVVSVDELDQVVDKTIAFATAPPVGPWRRNLLFIANESVGFQRRSDQIADTYSQLGYVPTKIYPHPSEPANEAHTQRIIEYLDNGVLAVHFIGHGGRYIWRTGPPDLAKNHDLFTLEHLDELAVNGRLPVVLSLTCYSAPFDHPTADSIGEKLMRISDRGAISVFAASWRNSPSPVMGDRLLAELTTPGNTIGEAVMRAKHEFRSSVLVQTYNLLGDPAVKVAAPGYNLELALDRVDGGLTLKVEIPKAVGSGQLIAEWVAQDGSTLREDRADVTGTDFSIVLDPGVLDQGEHLSGVRVYVWDEELGIDGIGWVGISDDGNPESQGTKGDDSETEVGNIRNFEKSGPRGQL